MRTTLYQKSKYVWVVYFDSANRWISGRLSILLELGRVAIKNEKFFVEYEDSLQKAVIDAKSYQNVLLIPKLQ